METEIVHVQKKPRKNAKVKETVETPRMDDPAPVKEKKPPTEKQIAARERMKVQRDEKKKEAEQARLKELYAQSEAKKVADAEAAAKEKEEAEKEFQKAEKKRLAAEKRRATVAAKKAVIDNTSTVSMPQPTVKDDPFSKAGAGIDERYTSVADPGPVKRTKPNPWGYESTGIRPVAANEPVTMMRKPNVGGRPQFNTRIR